MSRFHSYLNTAKQILLQYDGAEPFASFLKKFFSAEKKYGSTDRKQIAQLCYSYFRLGKSLPDLTIEEKLERDKITFAVKDIFPWKNELSEGIDHEKFCESFLVQPDLFIRIRPGFEEKVKVQLTDAGLNFKEMNENCLALSNASKIEEIVDVGRAVVVQDYNSQRVLEGVRRGTPDAPSGAVWDCCAASGGKSILMYDINPGIDLTVSDVRESILVNLKNRFKKAGIQKYHSFIADLSTSPFIPVSSSFDCIICDAPCSGSGTWSRTPEQLYFFEEKKIDQYASLQKKIVSNIIPHLRKGGQLIYITCSVFRKENEEVAAFIGNELKLQVKTMRVLKGYDKKADTMFVAMFERI